MRGLPGPGNAFGWLRSVMIQRVLKHLNTFVTSKVIVTQTDCQLLRWGLLLPRAPMEGYWGGSWPCRSLALCLACTVGKEPSPPSWALSWGQCLQVLNHFQGSQNSPLRSPRGWLAIASWLPGAFSERPGQLLPIGTNRLLCKRWLVFPWGFDGGAGFQS